jgi:hypothetical protein
MTVTGPLGGFVGDQAELTVRLNGALAAEPPEVVVRTETQPYVGVVPPEQRGGRRLGPAGAVQTVSVTFHKDNDGAYRGTLTLREAGWTRVAVRARGRNAKGQPFDLEETTNIPTEDIVARVAAFKAEGKDTNGDARFETLEVTVDLDVIVPGSYMIATGVSDAVNQQGPSTVIRQQLEGGRQRVVVSFPSGQIWNRLRTGPLAVTASLSLVLGGGGSFVAVPDKPNLKIDYRRGQWDPGAYSSEDTVTVHGIRPAASGRYGIAEVEWNASTPGGPCTWAGSLIDRKNEHYLYEWHSQTVPAGRRKSSFLFDGAGISAAGKGNWTFEASIACGDRKDSARFPASPLVLNSEDYEARPEALQIVGQVVLSQTAPQYWQAMLASQGNGAESAQFEITKLPAGWKGNFYPLVRGRNSNNVNLIVETPPGASPGRYFLEVTAAVGAQHVSREFVVELLEFVP